MRSPDLSFLSASRSQYNLDSRPKSWNRFFSEIISVHKRAMQNQYGEQKQKSLLRRILGTTSVYEDFCDKVSENKHWPFLDYGPYMECPFQNPKFYTAIWRIVSSSSIILMLSLYYHHGGRSHNEPDPPLSFVYRLICPLITIFHVIDVWLYWDQRTIVISKSQAWYEFRKGTNNLS